MGKSSSSSSAPADGRNNNDADVKYRGVRKRKWGKYVSEIRLPKSRDRIWLGSYTTAVKAARAFDAAQFCLRGADGAFNFPDDLPDIARGETLSRADILDVAYRYANGSGAGEQENGVSVGELERVGSVDWSVLESLGEWEEVGEVVDTGILTNFGHHHHRSWEYFNFETTAEFWDLS